MDNQQGREIRFASPRSEDMRAVVRDRLRRRLSATQRIGCPYRLVAYSATPGFETALWLPGEIMAKFFQGC